MVTHVEPDLGSGYFMPHSEGGLPRCHAIDNPLDAFTLVESSDFTAPQQSLNEATCSPLVMPPPEETPRKQRAPRDFSSPADVLADRSTLSWVNTLLGWIWPKANQALMQWVHEDLTPRLQEGLPAPFKKAYFAKFSLGRNTPDFGPIEVIQHSESHVQMDLEIRYVSDVDILIDAGTGGITFGINQLKFSGRLCIVLRPLVNRWPLIGAIKWFFSEKPQVALRFSGLAAMAHYPGMDSQVQKAVDQWIRSRVVLPNSRVWHFTRNEDIVDVMDAASHQPIGILRAKVLRSWKLPGVNWSALAVDRFTSDPYCILSLGAISHRSTTVQNTTDPIWPKGERSGYFVVYHKDQGLEVDVMGDDSSRIITRNFVSFLGRTPSTSVGSIMSWPHQSSGGNMKRGIRVGKVKLDTSKVNKEMLHVNDPVIAGASSEIELEAEWFSFADKQMLPTGTDHPIALFSVEVHKGTGFPQEAHSEKKGLRWRSRMNDGDALVSRRGQLCDVEQIEFPDIPIHPRLHSVIDKLVDRKFSTSEIAHIVGVDTPDVIEMYLRVKAEYEQKHQEQRRAQQTPDHRINLQWYETLTHFVHRVETETLTLDLLDSQDFLVGHIGPLSLRELFSSSAVTAARKNYSLMAPRTSEPGGLAAWFAPSRSHPVGVERYSTVEVRLSARLRYLTPARSLPKTSGNILENRQ